MGAKNLVPYSVYIPVEMHAKLKEAAALADFLIAVTPLTPETKGMIDGDGHSFQIIT